MNKMTPTQAAEILRQHNAWRRDNDAAQQMNPLQVGTAIDVVVAHLLPSGERGGVEGVVPSIERIGWDKECDDVDRIIEKLGMTIEQARTEGGCLHLPRILNHIQETLDALAVADGFGRHITDKYVAGVHAANHPPAQAAQVETQVCSCCGRDDALETRCTDCGEVQTIYTAKPTAEPVAQGEAVPATDAEIAAWAERHDLSFGGSKTDARDAFEDAESHRLTRPAAPAGVPAAWPKLELWFFRELVEAQRLKLFALHGMPVDEIGASHIHQKRALRQLLAAAPSQGEPQA